MKRHSLAKASLFWSLFNAVGSLSLNHTAATTHRLRVAHQEKGILTVSFNPDSPPTTSLQIINSISGGYRPGWLTTHGDLMCSISRTRFPDNSTQSGGIYTFRKTGPVSQRRKDSPAGELQYLSRTSSNGEGGVYCGISKDGKTLSAANIDGSTVSIHPLSKDGVVGASTYVFRYNLSTPGPGTNDSQIQSNPHQSIFDPSGQFMVVPDRGADLIYIYRVFGSRDVRRVRQIVLPPGTGPRHVQFSKSNSTATFMYLVSELDNTLRVYSFDIKRERRSSRGTNQTLELDVSLLQVASTLGLGSNRTEPNNKDLAAEVAFSSDGRFAYVSNRNTVSFDSDTLAIFAINPVKTSEHLSYLGQNKTYGKIPRHFSLSSDYENLYVAVANEVSNELILFNRDKETGFLGSVVGNLSLGALDLVQAKGPTSVIWW